MPRLGSIGTRMDTHGGIEHRPSTAAGNTAKILVAETTGCEVINPGMVIHVAIAIEQVGAVDSGFCTAAQQ